MIADTLNAQRTDTLLLFRQGQSALSKVGSDSLQQATVHTEQEVGHTMQQTDSGFEGTPIPYSPLGAYLPLMGMDIQNSTCTVCLLFHI